MKRSDDGKQFIMQYYTNALNEAAQPLDAMWTTYSVGNNQAKKVIPLVVGTAQYTNANGEIPFKFREISAYFDLKGVTKASEVNCPICGIVVLKSDLCGHVGFHIPETGQKNFQCGFCGNMSASCVP
eukprot:1216282-Ditylum_brightwellii.AAC.1